MRIEYQIKKDIGFHSPRLQVQITLTDFEKKLNLNEVSVSIPIESVSDETSRNLYNDERDSVYILPFRMDLDYSDVHEAIKELIALHDSEIEKALNCKDIDETFMMDSSEKIKRLIAPYVTRDKFIKERFE